MTDARRPDATSYTISELARYTALVIFACAAVYDYIRGFVEGVLEVRRRQLATHSRPVTYTPRPKRTYEVLCDKSGEVTLNGLPIGHIDSGPWQFCSYDLEYGNGPARATEEQAWDDANNYAEAVARTA